MDNKKILIVEDDPNFGSILKDYLSLNEYDIVLAKNGIEGYEKFKKDNFDLCILDVMMPFKDGFTLAKEIREKNDSVPIIFLTAKNLKEDVLKGFKLGADDYITKPFDSDVLLAKIKVFLNRNQKWIAKYDHNQLRITRAIRSLRLLVGDIEADNFRQSIFDYLGEDVDLIGEKAKSFWKSA